jgi:peptidoglycan/xylan/chitin deacetylase (PgdA/CDA1 family)
VYCAAAIDAVGGNDLPSISAGMARARGRGETIHLYTHTPGVTVPWAKLEAVLALAQADHLAYVTYAELAAGATPGPSIALSFDDSAIDSWTAARPLFATYGARATFFVTRYPQFTVAGKAALRTLADDGHDIEAHTLTHQRAPDMVADRGLAAWLDDEAVPSLEVLRADGYDPVAFAYPFGDRTDETDRAILGHAQVVRSVAFSVDGPIVTDPCPR